MLCCITLKFVFYDRTFVKIIRISNGWYIKLKPNMSYSYEKIELCNKADPRYMAKNNSVMFTVELGFFIVFFISLFPGISKTFVLENQIFYLESAVILILTVWFATFSESLSEAQAKARVDSLKNLEKEVTARKLEYGKEVIEAWS